MKTNCANGRHKIERSIIACLVLSGFSLAGQDNWEVLPEVPFPHGVSCGGGLATDGTCIYAADLSGDGNNDYIDLDENGAYTAGEYLFELGIPNGSVRVARYDPDLATWESLPAINAAGVGGDAFSGGDFNGSLFHAEGQLYYYQFRAGPNRCALYRYDLATGLTGAWTEVWDLDTTTALINGSAGLTGAVGPDGPVILHHCGGGEYSFARSTGIDGVAMETHLELTPSWPFSGAHFPRNGAWAYDPLNGALFHMSGNQLVRWDPSSVYAPDDFTTAVPNGSDALAVFSTAIASLKNALGWDPGGTLDNPGASLWGNDIVVVNDPTGLLAGPAGEDTGANVLYLVRGETTANGWPYNEGRGAINNGDFARYFPATGNTQSLPEAPFHVGKGSSACYLDGYIYLLQGETTASATPSSADSIKGPGKGFARFSMLSESQGTTGSPIIPVGDYIDGGFVSLTAPPDTGTGTTPLFDEDWSTFFEASLANPVEIVVEFVSQKETGAARARFGDTTYEWSLDAANSMADLTSGTGSYISLFSGESVSAGSTAWREWNSSTVSRRIYRFTVERLDAGAVIIRELELQRPLPIVTIQAGGSPVAVNYLEILPENPRLEAGSSTALTAEASLSLGPDRYDVSGDAAWSSSNHAVATIDPDGTAHGLSAGISTIGATLSSLTAGTELTVVTVGPQDEDVSVAWIQRLPVMDYVWESPQPDIDGWPSEGSTVTWRAMVKNWYPFTRYAVSYRWLVDGLEIAGGRTDLAPSAWTPVDLPRTWTFAREELAFEIDPLGECTEVSESNNTVTVCTDAISVGFWVEQSVYDYFHQYQHELEIGSNGWEDYAQRQLTRWNTMWEEAVHPVDAPDGVLDRVRLDKITLVEDGALPLQGGSYPTNYPDTSDRSIDLMWGFPATLLNGTMYDNHTDPEDWNPFYFEGSLIHELGHARYLIDCYGFNVVDGASFPSVHVTQNGGVIAGTPYLPRTWPFWDHVHISWAGIGNPYEGLMSSDYTFIDRYSAAALNLIAGHRAWKGNFNAPYNIGIFRNDLPLQNTVQLFDGRGHPIPDATVSLYQATGADGVWYGKQYDDMADLVFTGDADGFVDVGQNPFAAGSLEHTYGISDMVALLKVESAERTGFAFLEAGLFNMEAWRGHADHGYYSLTVPMISDTREIAFVRVFPNGTDWRVNVIASGDSQPDAITVDGQPADYQEGSWWGWVRSGSGPKLITANWPGGPSVAEWFKVPSAHPVPVLHSLSATSHSGAIDMDLFWKTRSGDAYGLEWSPDLQGWSTLPGGWIFGNGASSLQPISMPGPAGYYRITVYPLGHQGVVPY
ncbi:MAG: Ig-like domain-containing protein [Oceanipulchritudo sp.]